MAPAEIVTKRVYEGASFEDGLRVLVDRLWPRGISKQAAYLDTWLKQVAPSDELRTWFDHDPDKWEAFCQRYTAELEQDQATQEAVAWLEDQLQSNDRVTLLYAAKDTDHNNAVALAAYLREHR